MMNRSAKIFVYVRRQRGERESRSDLRSAHAIIQCRILHHCINWGWMITTFLKSSMPSLKMQMSDSHGHPTPSTPSSPPLLISPLWFIHFLCWRARQDNGVFHKWGCVPTTSTLQSPRAPHQPGSLIWPGHGGLVLMKHRKRNNIRSNVYSAKHCQVGKDNQRTSTLLSKCNPPQKNKKTKNFVQINLSCTFGSSLS